MSPEMQVSNNNLAQDKQMKTVILECQWCEILEVVHMDATMGFHKNIN